MIYRILLVVISSILKMCNSWQFYRPTVLRMNLRQSSRKIDAILLCFIASRCDDSSYFYILSVI